MNGNFTISRLIRKMLGVAIIFSLSAVIWIAPQPAFGQDTRGFLWQDGTMTDLSPLEYAVDINNFGQVVGGRQGTPLIWQNGTITNIGRFPGDYYAEATGINDSGQVVGLSRYFTNSDHFRGFFWQSGTMTDLGTLGGGGAASRQFLPTKSV